MFRAVRAVRVSLKSRVVAARTGPNTIRTFSSSPRALAGDHHGPPQLYGPNKADPAGIPTDEDQATGLERFQLLGKMEGVDVFDMQPLDASRLGTMKDPIKVPTLFNDRVIGCSGFPADSHDTLWIACDVNRNNNRHRCPECGSVYALDFQGSHEPGGAPPLNGSDLQRLVFIANRIAQSL